MKLRIHGDSLRLRLTQAEARRLGTGQGISQTTHFSANTSFVTDVEVSAPATALTASLHGSHLTVVIPVGQARTWAHTDQVALQASQSAGTGRNLELLVEKDFRCLHSASPADADGFPNPRQG